MEQPPTLQHGAYDMPQVMLVAYLFEFVGVFLLAVEAIKLENLRGMRARIQWIYRIFNPPVVRGPEADDPDLKKVVIAIWLLGLATQLLFLLLLFVIGGINALDEYPKLYIPEARTRPGMDIMTGIFFLFVPGNRSVARDAFGFCSWSNYQCPCLHRTADDEWNSRDRRLLFLLHLHGS